jgi:hypothetical protein
MYDRSYIKFGGLISGVYVLVVPELLSRRRPVLGAVSAGAARSLEGVPMPH